MKTNQPRNREKRTKPGKMEESVPLRVMVTRSTYNLVKDLERSHRTTKEEIFLAGLQAVDR